MIAAECICPSALNSPAALARSRTSEDREGKLQDQLLALSQKLTAAEHAAEDARLALTRKSHEFTDAQTAIAAAEAAARGAYLLCLLLWLTPPTL